MFAIVTLIAMYSSQAPTVFTVRETVIVSTRHAEHLTCTKRDLIQGSGTVKICDVTR